MFTSGAVQFKAEKTKGGLWEIQKQSQALVIFTRKRGGTNKTLGREISP